MERVFLDSNVLYPISVADLMLRLGDIALHEILWSEDLLAEVERSLIDRKGLTPEQADYFCDCIRSAFPHGEIRRSRYQHLIGSRTGPDPDDRVHAAAAVGGGATTLVTWNTKDFPEQDLGDTRKLNPDAYLVEVLAEHPDETLGVLHEMASQRRNPQTIQNTLAALRNAGLKRFTREAATLLANR